MIYIGIDPGANGGLGYQDTENNIEKVLIFNEKDYLDTLYELSKQPCKCCLEKVHAMPGQGVTSMFSMGDNYGYIRGLLEAFKIPYQAITPIMWKKEYGLNSDKSKSIDVCRRLFPHVSLLLTERSKKAHDGMAEALLMSDFAKRKM